MAIVIVGRCSLVAHRLPQQISRGRGSAGGGRGHLAKFRRPEGCRLGGGGCGFLVVIGVEGGQRGDCTRGFGRQVTAGSRGFGGRDLSRAGY